MGILCFKRRILRQVSCEIIMIGFKLLPAYPQAPHSGAQQSLSKHETEPQLEDQ